MIWCEQTSITTLHHDKDDLRKFQDFRRWPFPNRQVHSCFQQFPHSWRCLGAEPKQLRRREQIQLRNWSKGSWESILFNDCLICEMKENWKNWPFPYSLGFCQHWQHRSVSLTSHNRFYMNRLVIENSISSLTVSYCRSYLLVLCANGSDRKAEMLMERTRTGYIGSFLFLEAAPSSLVPLY